jgi:pilus assembly protein CpaC
MRTDMIKKSAIILALIAMIGGSSVLSHSGKAWAEKGDLTISEMSSDPMVDIMLGKAEMVTLKGDIADVLVANPSIVDVMAVKANQLYLVGNALGDTNIMVLDDEGNVVKKINIHVQMDTNKLEAMIKELYPNESVKIKALTDQLVVTGHVSTPATSNSIANLVAQYAAEIQGGNAGNIDEFVTNMLTVAGEQQVMLKVKIIEASRSALKDLGIETEATDSGIGAVGAAITAASGLGLTAPAQLGVLALNYTSGSFGPLSFLARALEEEGIVNTLAEPNLTAISGEQAGFLAGGEIPIPTEIDRNGNLIYEFRPFGVSLNFRPTVMSANRISMEMTTEVSSATYDDNLQLQGITVPTFNVRRADTTVELPSGGTLMIAGLLQSDTVSSLTSLPGVNKIPVVGDLIKSDSFQRNETELVVMITPYLVKPFAQNESVPDPMPVKTSGKDNLDGIPRLSMEDLENLPEEGVVNQSPSKMAMAPPTGLSQEPMLKGTPLAKQGAQPEREKNALSRVFENNIKRTYNSKKVDSVMKDMGSFGYMME